MLTKPQLGQMWADAKIAFCLDKVPSTELAFARAVEAAARAAARAEVEPLVRQMLEALDHYAARDAVTEATIAARAWLSPQDERMAAALLSPRISIPPSMGREEVRAWIEKHAQADKPGGLSPQVGDKGDAP